MKVIESLELQECVIGCMMTPKEFTVRANKDRQKDWKGSIRIGKSNLRYNKNN